MFKSARLKLTAWYLLIIMFISLMFSTFIYALISSEVERLVRIQQFRFENRFPGGIITPPRSFATINGDLINDVKHRLIIILTGVNGTILIISAGLGYFLAGRTLKPIQIMVNDQNRFISDSSHELRTPLTAIKTSIEVALRNPKLSLNQTKKLLKDNLTDINHLQYLSDGLLKLAKFQQPIANIELKKVILSKIVDQALQKITPIAKSKNIKLIKSLSEISFYADPVQISELLIILLDNAVKYSHSGQSVIISSKIINHQAYIEIKDQGIGISPKDLPHIFDRFFRADSARSRSGVGGYGLGLSIAKKIVEAHHGSISVKSTLGLGSSFIIILPLTQS